MQSLINDKSSLENSWEFIEEPSEIIPEGKVILPAPYWLENLEKLKNRDNTAIWFDSDAELNDYLGLISTLPLIAINFTAFANGRGYSLARLIKERTKFKGQLRAVGDVLLDQLYYMKRCGFDSFLLKDGLSAEKALNYFSTFSDPYQLAYDLPSPLFRRKA